MLPEPMVVVVPEVLSLEAIGSATEGVVEAMVPMEMAEAEAEVAGEAVQ